jgi:Asp-tRNA(Asn)/Glu-tRNA(Gln) amidotransferase C subunit
VIKEMKAPLGKDEVSEHLPAEKFLRGAPARVGGFLKVPVVIEDKEDV